jgi:hypothetical protein
MLISPVRRDRGCIEERGERCAGVVICERKQSVGSQREKRRLQTRRTKCRMEADACRMVNSSDPRQTVPRDGPYARRNAARVALRGTTSGELQKLNTSGPSWKSRTKRQRTPQSTSSPPPQRPQPNNGNSHQKPCRICPNVPLHDPLSV